MQTIYESKEWFKLFRTESIVIEDNGEVFKAPRQLFESAVGKIDWGTGLIYGDDYLKLMPIPIGKIVEKQDVTEVYGSDYNDFFAVPILYIKDNEIYTYAEYYKLFSTPSGYIQGEIKHNSQNSGSNQARRYVQNTSGGYSGTTSGGYGGTTGGRGTTGGGTGGGGVIGGLAGTSIVGIILVGCLVITGVNAFFDAFIDPDNIIMKCAFITGIIIAFIASLCVLYDSNDSFIELLIKGFAISEVAITIIGTIGCIADTCDSTTSGIEIFLSFALGWILVAFASLLPSLVVALISVIAAKIANALI